MTEPLLSAALIVRDEARHLEDCLASIRGFVEQVVVVDTGSSDGSIEIARAAGAEVHEIAWPDDFAAARNAALAHCRGAWILSVDADERVVRGTAHGLRALLRDPMAVGCRVWRKAARGLTPYREMRLFRNDPRIRFAGIIHEEVGPALLRYVAAEGGRLQDSGLVLDHVGYDGDQTRKHHRNLPLLLKRLEGEPEHSYSRWHLGATYARLGDREAARRAWQAGLAAARCRRRRDWTDSGCYIGLVELDFQDPKVADPLLDEALQRYPDHPHLVWLKARALMRDRAYAEAVPVLEKLAALRSRLRLSDGVIAVDERLFGLFAYDGLATCHLRLKKYKEAARWYQLAETCAPEPLGYQVKRQLCMKLARRPASS